MKPRVFLPAIVSGLLLWASFFPLDLGPLAFVALVPWLSLVRAENVSRRRRYFAAYVGGLAFYLPALQWIRVAHPAMYASWIGLSLYCSGYFAFALFLLRRLDRLLGWPLAFTLPVVWVALEYMRAHFCTGFPVLQHVGLYQLIGFGWYMLGYTQHATLPLLQLADLGGVYLVTAVVAAFNGAAFEWFIRQPFLRRVFFRYPPEHRLGFFREMWVSAAAMIALMVGVAYGSQKLQHPEFDVGPRVTAIQGDIPQDVKMDNEDLLFNTYLNLSINAAKRADLVIWPETCMPYKWYSIAPNTPKDEVPAKFMALLTKRKAEFARLAQTEWRTNMLVGLGSIEYEGGKEWIYNSAVLFDADGRDQGRYDKMHLVPFGEYVPLKEYFPWMQVFTPYKGDYSCRPGEHYTRFPLAVGEKLYTFGCIICYEDSDPYIARQYVRTEPVDFLVNISNDGWFDGTEEHEQHLAICRFRAVEARRSVVRAVNMGISAFIDPDGRVVALPGDSWSQSKRMEGTVTDRVKIDRRESFYAMNGDWLPVGCWGLLVLGHIASIIQRRRLA